MRGHIRRRGERSYEYIVDVGIAEAQRCRSCGRRFWLERKPRQCCPKCGGELAETEERRRAIKGGFTTRRECEAALAKILASLEAQTFTPPTKVTVKQFLLQEWLPTVKGSLRPTTYASYVMLTREHITPRLGTLQLQKLTPAALNALYAACLRTAACAERAASLPPRCAGCTPCCTRPAGTRCAGDAWQATRSPVPIRPRQPPSTRRSCVSGTPSGSAPSLPRCRTTVSSPSGDCWRPPACAGERPSVFPGRPRHGEGCGDDSPRLDPGERHSPVLPSPRAAAAGARSPSMW